MAEAILKSKKTDVGQLVLIPAGGGRFEVTVDGKLVYSKLDVGRFPEHEEVLGQL